MAQKRCPLSDKDKTAIAIAPDYTYAQLDYLAAQALHGLQGHGIKKGDCIALPSHADAKTIALLFAAWRLGAVVALISPSLPLETKLRHLQRIPLRLLIEDTTSLIAASIDERRELELESVSLLLMTSGSSGDAKWAAFTLGQLFESAQTISRALNAQPQDRWLLSLPLHHVGGLGVMLRALISGGSIVLENRQLPYPDRIVSAQARFASLIPTQLYRLLQSGSAASSTHLLIGGAPISQQLYHQATEKKHQLSLTYGMTEMCSTVLLTSNPVWHQSIPYLGHPLPGRAAKISSGEIFVAGQCLFSGYGYPPQSPANGWLATGDCGIYHEKYGFAVVGRKDFQFICSGENIQPEEIEVCLLSCPSIEQVIVVPLFDEEFGARPMAFIKGSLSYDQIIAHASRFLPKYKIPVALAPLPKTGNLKPNRIQLIEYANKNYHIINATKRY